jgi:hypothetical protein
MSGIAKLLLWVVTFPVAAIVGRVLFGQSWQASLDGAWVATIAVGLGFLFEMTRDALGEIRFLHRAPKDSD